VNKEFSPALDKLAKEIEALHCEVETEQEAMPSSECEDYLPHEKAGLEQLDKEIEYVQESIDSLYAAMIDGQEAA